MEGRKHIGKLRERSKSSGTRWQKGKPDAMQVQSPQTVKNPGQISHGGSLRVDCHFDL